jgi:hypothetical protein
MNKQLIDEQWKDSDGYWIILKQGYSFHPERTIGIREDSKVKALRRLKDARKVEST